MPWMLLAIALFVAAAVVSVGMLLSALMMGRALHQTHNLNGIDLDLTDVEPRMASLDSQDFATTTTTARWTGAVVHRVHKQYIGETPC